MKYSIILSVALGLGGTACGGFTDVGQGGNAGGGQFGTGGAANQAGAKPTGGTTAAGGSTGTGHGGDQGTANAPSTGGAAGAGGAASQCQTSNDCPAIGASCQLCPDGSFACPFVECRAGVCVGSFPTCATQTCKVDSECPKSLAPCQLCDNGSSACPWARCENGTCKSGIDRCPGTNPCAGKACGETCSICGPDQSCPPVLMFCDAGEQCQLNQPSCAQTTCKLDTDCPALELCAPCADGSCAEERCLNGACQLSCGSGGGSCAAEQASCANGETCCAGLECCAGVPVPAGNEYCGKVCPKSDVNIKRDFVSVDPNQVLEKLSRLPVGIWSYRTEGSAERHIGPMAQDFMATFGVGSSDRTILQVDADGVSFAAIQALNARLTALEEQNQKLQRQLEEQRHRCER